ncbi:hypothetical protein AVEN_114433-1 [Araneus ventricosus]|uniref:Uncharacterized protein n=1 Tax=Araneus ventricosus TaxID=182803 RepID=A0A4Y2TPB9_ARAVE|nr:hypothetical protein AVEN_114433-1 [Araneus ventricosus]
MTALLNGNLLVAVRAIPFFNPSVYAGHSHQLRAKHKTVCYGSLPLLLSRFQNADSYLSDLLLREKVSHFDHLFTPVALAVQMKRLDLKTCLMSKRSTTPCQSSSTFHTNNWFWCGALANMQPQIYSS